MRLQIHGITLAYDIAGDGGPLLLLHGFPLSRRLWQPQLEGLVDAAQLIAPDLRGLGETGQAGAHTTLDQMADDCAGLLDGLRIARPVAVAGLSMGGYVAMAFARRHPGRVAGLILAATRAGADSPEGRAGRDRMAAQAREQGPEAVVEAMLPKMLAPETLAHRPDVVAQARAVMAGNTTDGIVAALMAMKERPDSSEWLASFTGPVLIVHGLEDQLIPPTEAEAMHALAPGSRLQLIPAAGHLLNLEHPLAFNAEVRTFLQTI